MMKKLLFALVFLLGAQVLHAQQYDISGRVLDEKQQPLLYTSVTLLDPKDSTLAFFGITNEEGFFNIKSVTKGDYLAQVSLIGFHTWYKKLAVPMQGGNNLGLITLKEDSKTLKEVQVNGERIPIQIKKDTIEYNAAAFKVKPDAVVEDLLKKLPGVEVDQAGNVKANGKGVQKVLVDGKEFFSDDPKVATKNLPADAIDKVQVFDKHSDQSLFTGIDDGDRERTINLMLKDGKKHGYFGDVQAGYGTGNHYQGGAKVYSFAKETQLAALGMINNINQFGVSLQDYINFNGGMRGLMDGGGRVSLRMDNSMPIDFGQPVTGLTTSGAGGLNFTYEPRKGNRFNISYLGNGAQKKLKEQTNTTNYTGEEAFTQDQNNNEKNTNWGHRLNVLWRNNIDSSQQLLADGGAGLTTTATNRQAVSTSSIRKLALNQLFSTVDDNGNGWNANGRISYLKRFKGNWPVYKVFVEGDYEKTYTGTNWSNRTDYFDTSGSAILYQVHDNQYQDQNNEKYSYTVGTSIVRSLGNGYYLEPGIRATNDMDILHRRQGPIPKETGLIDSLSPDYSRSFRWLRPGLSFRKSSEKVQFNIGVNAQAGLLSSTLPATKDVSKSFIYVLPSAMWQYEYKTGKQVSISYSSDIKAPSVTEMLPVKNYVDPLYVTIGNRALLPEYAHSLYLNWFRFDQFAFTSLFASLSGVYTHNKINWARTVNPGLSQSATLINVPDDYNLTGRVEYSTPIRALGINVSVALDENYNKGISSVNAVYNSNNTFTHGGKLTFNNRKKEKLDVEIGGGVNITDSRYSIDKSLNNVFYNYNGFGQISYHPTDHWYFMLNADVNRYDAKSFNSGVTIPLLKAAASWYFLKGNRGVLTLDGFDLLNQNKSLQRVSQLNYLMEKRSNVIGRYVMLSFKYRLSKTGNNNTGPGGVQISVK